MFNIYWAFFDYGGDFMLKEELLQKLNLDKMKCSFYIKNLKEGDIFKYNEDVKVPSASIIKIPIMAEILRQVKEGKLNLKQRIKVSHDIKVPFSILTLMDDENTYSLKDIITLMIIQSDNTATNVLIDLAGMDNVNKFIKSCGLKNTILQRKMMDSTARQKGLENYTSARDMAVLLEMIYKGELVDNASCKVMVEIMKEQLDRAMMMLNIPDETVVAHKTGELECLNHDVGIVYHKECDYIFAMLVWDAESNNLARNEISRASYIVYNYFINKGRNYNEA